MINSNGSNFELYLRLKYDPQNLKRKWEHHDTPKSGRNILSILFCSQDPLPRAKVRVFIPLYIHFLNLSEPLTTVSQRAAMHSLPAMAQWISIQNSLKNMEEDRKVISSPPTVLQDIHCCTFKKSESKKKTKNKKTPVLHILHSKKMF